MTCWSLDEIVEYVDGTMPPSRVPLLEAHLATCAACAARRDELRHLVASLEADADEQDDPAMAGDILRRIEQGEGAARPRATAPRRPVVVAAAVATLALAAAVVLMVTLPGGVSKPPSERRPAFVARGTGEEDLDRSVRLWVYQRRAGATRYAPVEGTLPTDARLVFGYQNASATLRHLMVFGLSSGGELHWYYPAYEEEETDPRSVPAQTGRHELTAEIQHALRPGRLRVFAVLSADPLRVSRIEGLVERLQRQRPGQDLTTLDRLPLAGVAQVSELLHVAPADGGDR